MNAFVSDNAAYRSVLSFQLTTPLLGEGRRDHWWYGLLPPMISKQWATARAQSNLAPADRSRIRRVYPAVLGAHFHTG
jgi:hypothetical protein